VAKPVLDQSEIEAIKRPLTSGWVTQGPEVEAFEKEFAAYVGARHACAVSSCTTALHLALLTVGVQPGDSVITASHSFIATANSVRYCGALPVFVDIVPETFNMDPDLIEAAITHTTRAILCVHQLGMPCDLGPILEIARNKSLFVIEDCACAIGSEILWHNSWEKIGKPHGDIACFSFHPRKLITTGDGGMLTTADPEIDQKFRLLRHHGMSISDRKRFSSDKVMSETYDILGYNYRLTDIQAAMGRSQLQKLPEIVKRRRFLAQRYLHLMADIPQIRLPDEPDCARCNWQTFCVYLPERCDQKSVMQYMLDRGVATRKGVMCSHREPAYQQLEAWSCGRNKNECQCPPGTCRNLTYSEYAQDHSIVLPLYTQMTDEDQDYVVSTFTGACEHAD